MVIVNCAGIAESLTESELFGLERAREISYLDDFGAGGRESIKNGEVSGDRSAYLAQQTTRLQHVRNLVLHDTADAGL